MTVILKTKMMIRIITRPTYILLGLFLGFGANAQESKNTVEDIVELDRIIAVANDDVLMESELVIRIRKVSQELREKDIPPPPVHILQKQVLERLILQRLQIQEAIRSGIVVEDQALNRTLQKIAESNNLTLRQFRGVLERDGFSFAQFREDVRNEIMIGRVRSRKVRNRVKVTDQEIDHLLENIENRGEFSNQYRVGHILIAIPDGSTSGAILRYQRKAEAVLKELKDGADFRQTAAANSDAQTALEGGELGWRKRGELPSAFTDIVPKLSVGRLSEVIRMPAGFHIIKLFETRGGEKVMVKQTMVRHILVKPGAILTVEDARARIEQLRNRILSGESFSKLAKSNSDDMTSAVNGGSLGWTLPGKMVAKFEAVMNKANLGEVSEPFQSQFGWHILLVEDRRDYDGTLEYRRNKARQIILKRKTEEELELWIRRLRDEAYVELRLEQS